MANGRTEHARRVKHAFGVPDRDALVLVVVLEFFNLQNLAHRLRNAQVAGRQQHHEAVVRLFVNDHFAKGADLVETRIGARIGQKNQSGVEFDGDAISHVYRVKLNGGSLIAIN
jgi:hypothetical protein